MCSNTDSFTNSIIDCEVISESFIELMCSNTDPFTNSIIDCEVISESLNHSLNSAAFPKRIIQLS